MSTHLYRPEKRFFTEQDFEEMGWRGNPIHAIAFGPGTDELSLDLDYLFKCEHPSAGAGHRTFWVSPATLVFENVGDLTMQACARASLTIVELDRKELKESRFPGKLWRWRLICTEGEWGFYASGYRQFIRRPPELVGSPRLAPEARGGYALVCPNRQ